MDEIFECYVYVQKSIYLWFCLYWILEEVKPVDGDRNQNSSFRGQISGKGREAPFWGHGNVLYLEWDSDYTGVNMWELIKLYA